MTLEGGVEAACAKLVTSRGKEEMRNQFLVSGEVINVTSALGVIGRRS